MADWDDVERLVLAQPAGKDAYLLKSALPHPAEAGMDRHFGLPKRGSFRHYRRRVRGISCLHVREYPDHYECHWDRVDPRLRPLGHWWHDVRGGKSSIVASAGALAALVAVPLL